MPDEPNVHVLLVEDNPGDVVLITDIIKEFRPDVVVHVARDGIEATYFINQKESQGSPRPAIIILDLNLPRYDGRELLAELKSSPKFKRIPVIVLTGSSSPVDVSTCYDLCANCYLVKPLDLGTLTDVVRSLLDFWLSKVKLPLD